MKFLWHQSWKRFVMIESRPQHKRHRFGGKVGGCRNGVVKVGRCLCGTEDMLEGITLMRVSGESGKP